MTPILGIIASQITGHLSTNSYESIQTVTLGASQTTVTFSSIPQTYKHLQIRGIARSTRAVTLEGAWAYFNNDTSTTTYAVHGIAGDGASASSYAIPTPNSGGLQGGIISAASATSSIFGVFVMDILDYTNTNKNTTTRSLTGADLNGSGTIRLISGLWLNTAAITSIKFDTQAGGDFTQYSSFALYGIKG
jgi:hypothetical protein